MSDQENSQTLAPLNYTVVHSHLVILAQPSLAHLQWIKSEGFSTVISLTPVSDLAKPLAEDSICLELGLDYIQLPLLWEQPSTTAGLLILDLIDHLVQEQKVWLHCASGQRAASLMYLYRQFYMGMDIVEADQLLEQVWSPDETWTGFIHALRLQLQARQATKDIQSMS